MAHTLNTYAAGYQNLFDTLVIKKEKLQEVDTAVKKISAGKTRYQAMEAKTGVPWFFIGLLHYMEAAGNFTKHLHNGDPLTRRTVQVPSGRPRTGTPPFTWEQSALDALQLQGLDKVTNWSLPQMLFLLESFNGFGYRNKGIYSPYLWSYSNHYTKGKYESDGVYNANLISKQAGAAVILYRTLALNNLLAKYIKAAAGGAASLIAIAAFFF